MRNILLSSLFVSIACASTPEGLLLHTQPIDALCFFNLEGQPTNIDLNNCGYSKYKYTVKGHNTMLLKKGFIGYDWQDSAISGNALGSSYYKIFAAGNNRYWIYTINKTSGSGDFTSIQLIKRKNASTLETKTIAGGDRCNGGVQNVSATNYQLTFSINLTAYDLITLANNHDTSIKAYDDLAACAVCCVAKAFYTVGANTKPQLNYIALGDVRDPKQMPSQGKYQACFNKLLTSHVQAGLNQLNEKKLHKFINQFNKTCLNN